ILMQRRTDHVPGVGAELVLDLLDRSNNLGDGHLVHPRLLAEPEYPAFAAEPSCYGGKLGDTFLARDHGAGVLELKIAAHRDNAKDLDPGVPELEDRSAHPVRLVVAMGCDDENPLRQIGFHASAPSKNTGQSSRLALQCPSVVR